MIIYFFVNLKSIFYFKSLTKLPSKFIPVVPGLFSTFSPSASLSSSCSPYRHYLSHFSSLKIYLKYFHCGKLHRYHCISAMPFHASILARLSHRYCLLTKSSPPSLPPSLPHADGCPSAWDPHLTETTPASPSSLSAQTYQIS